MTDTNRNCFRSQGGGVIELNDQKPAANTPSSQHGTVYSDDAIPPRAETAAASPSGRSIKQYYFYD